jgi:hypothetical protein
VNAFQKRRKTPPYNFAYGRSDLEAFPFEMWRRTLLRCARRASYRGLTMGQAPAARRYARLFAHICDGHGPWFATLCKLWLPAVHTRHSTSFAVLPCADRAGGFRGSGESQL